jgi:hypothetical protein
VRRETRCQLALCSTAIALLGVLYELSVPRNADRKAASCDVFAGLLV